MKRLLKNCTIIAFENDTFKEYKNGYLGIDGDTIDYIGEDRPLAIYDEEKDMRGKLLSAGFINTHTHSAMELLRGLGSDKPLHDWLFDDMFPTEARMLPEDFEAGMKLAILEMLASGTTSFTDMYMAPRTMAKLIMETGIKGSVTRATSCFDPNEQYENHEVGKDIKDLYENYHNLKNGRLKVDFSIHAEYTNFPQIVKGYSDDCKKYGARMHIHLSETKAEVESCIAKYGKSPVAWFCDLGVFDNPTMAAHCVALSDEDINILAKYHVNVMHNPTSNMKLGSGFSPVAKLIERGINVSLGTDGSASNNNLNMLEEMHIASIIHKGYHQDPTLLSAETILKMATINGAITQGRNDTGCLSVGKKADIVAFNLNKPHLTPNFDSIALIVYSMQASDVCMTMVDGEILYENGVYYTIDPEKVYQEVNEAVKRLYQK